ncbi:ABC transporter ATP-binding protein [Thermogladius sp. KZ2Tp1]|uniref:ABC transporter ATP-binding protein n=1 Tax=Thermogladius sp. KZ2Tp1 TaxID=3136289 RepID=UPI003DA9BA2C
MIAVDITGLAVEYGGMTALKVDKLRLQNGVVNCVLGPNGAGKSSLLRAVAGIVNYKGTITITAGGTKIDKRDIHRFVSYVADIQPSSIRLRVREALLSARYPCSPGFFYTVKDFEYVEKVSRALGVADLLDRTLNELSSGELQRVLLAMALVKDPLVVLLDEPDTHLDLYNKSRLSVLVKSIAADKLVTVSTHDPVFASLVCDRIVLLYKGIVLRDFKAEELTEHVSTLERVFKTRLVATTLSGRSMLLPDYTTTLS